MNQNSSIPESSDFLIITALQEEQDAVLSKLPKFERVEPSEDDIRIYYYSHLPVTYQSGSAGECHLIVTCLLGMGRVQASIATADAIRRWNCPYVILVGIAGAISDIGINYGDILISDQIVDYELQKLTHNGPELRWEVYRADPRLLGAAQNFDFSKLEIKCKYRRPDGATTSVHFGPIASGDKVITVGDILRSYRDNWPKLIGVEMEAGGAAAACFQANNPPGFFMIRGVSDLADKDKGSTEVKKWRPFACDVSASYTVELLKSGILPLRKRQKSHEPFNDADIEKFPDLLVRAGKAEVYEDAVPPPPDAGLDKFSPPTPKPAFSLDAASYQSMALDIGTVWGLNRQSYLGIFAGEPDDDLYETLIYVERALYDATIMENHSTLFPSRWWIRLNPQNYPNGPQNVHDVWNAALDMDNPLVHYLKNNDISDIAILGFFFNIYSTSLNNQNQATIQYWIDALMGNLFSSNQPATIIHIIGDAPYDAVKTARSLRDALGEIQSIIPELMVLDGRMEHPGDDIDLEDESRDPFASPAPRQPGRAFYSWIKAAMSNPRAAKELRREQERAKYEAVTIAYQGLMNTHDNTVPDSSTVQIVKDLEDISSSSTLKIYQQFFQLIHRYFPEKIQQLMRTCAESQLVETRRQALKYASAFDLLMDAWVDGAFTNPDSLPDGNMLVSDPYISSSVKDLALALLRRYMNKKCPLSAKLIAEMKPYLYKDLSRVCKLCFEEISKEDFIAESGASEFLLSLRAGVMMDLDFKLLRETGFDEPELCWLISSTVFRKEQIAELLKFDVKHRAVIGLCTFSEWTTLQADKELMRRINDCRRNRHK